jgi:hypothetical protein
MRGRVPVQAMAGVVLALFLTLVGAGCGGTGAGDDNARVASATDADSAADTGTDGSGATDGEDASGLSQEEKALKFAECMRENGVPMEDPDPQGGGGIRIGGEGVDRETVQEAQEACQEYAPFGEDGPRPDPKMAENMRKFAQCMRDSGVPDFPDPDGGRMMLDKSVADDPDFEAAHEKCGEKFLPDRLGGKGGPQ